MLAAILLLLLSGFVFGALARWAVPGPTRCRIWLTILVGLGGSAIGGGITAAILGAGKNVSRADYFTIELASILTSILLVVAYRALRPAAADPRPRCAQTADARLRNRAGLPPSFTDAMRKAQLLKSLET